MTEILNYPDLRALQTHQAHALQRLDGLLRRLPVNDLTLLADSLEYQIKQAGTFQSGTGTLAVAIMRQLGVKVRVAEWILDKDCHCQHKRYVVGDTVRARIGEIGHKIGDTWIEAWIA